MALRAIGRLMALHTIVSVHARIGRMRPGPADIHMILRFDGFKVFKALMTGETIVGGIVVLGVRALVTAVADLSNFLSES